MFRRHTMKGSSFLMTRIMHLSSRMILMSSIKEFSPFLQKTSTTSSRHLGATNSVS
jgi:hypothetical protein